MFGSKQMWEFLSPQQREEALGGDNKFYCGEKIGHEPNWDEAVFHYFCNIMPQARSRNVVSENTFVGDEISAPTAKQAA